MSTIEKSSTGQMIVKRDLSLEPVDLNKIVRSIEKHSEGLPVDPMTVAVKTIGGIHHGASTRELDELSIRTAASLVYEEPAYSKLAARILSTYIDKEVSNQGITSFSQSLQTGFSLGLIGNDTYEFVRNNASILDSHISNERDDLFEFFGLSIVQDRYLLRHPNTRLVIETPQYWFMRVACGLSYTLDEALSVYDALSQFYYMTATPTLFNSGTRRPQMSSCYLLAPPKDSLESIFGLYADIAQLSKWSGGIGVPMSTLRSAGSIIRGTNGQSNGVVPWMKILDSTISAVDQGGGKRKGAACVYLEPWHADIEDFLQAKDNTGDPMRRTHHLNLANWIPDLFMRRVEQDTDWSLFDPADVPEFTELFGARFEDAYTEAERRGIAVRTIKARELYGLMMRTLAQTGNGWMNFKDAGNLKSNQTGQGPVIHSSNLCTEIFEVNDSGTETASVCNLASINLSRFVKEDRTGFDFDEMSKYVRLAVKMLDRVVDINFYPTEGASASNENWRPVGLGVMGLQDVFFKLGHAFESEEANLLSTKIAKEIYYHALCESLELAKEYGPHPSFYITRAAIGELQFDLWGVYDGDPRWNALKMEISVWGLRNSLLIAYAPTATIASIVGVYECVEPQTSNLFKRGTLSGEFLQVNKFLVEDLKRIGLWDEQMRSDIRASEGSIQNIERIPTAFKKLYKTVWEVPMRNIIDMAASRGKYIDQSQSLNLFMESPNIGKLSSMYMHVWKQGLKSTYYLRSRSATKIKQVDTVQAVACSLENPETCSACE